MSRVDGQNTASHNFRNVRARIYAKRNDCHDKFVDIDARKRENHVIQQQKLHDNRRAPEKPDVYIADFRNPLEYFALLSRNLDNSNEGTYTDTYQKAEYGNVRCVFETQQYIFVSFVLNERPYKDLPLFFKHGLIYLRF